MFTRIMVAVVGVPLIFVVLYAMPPIAIPIALSVICAIGVYEALCATKFLNHKRVTVYSILLAGLIPFWAYTGGGFRPAMAGIFLYVLLLFCEAIASGNTLGLERIGGTFFLTLLIPLALTAFIRIRALAQWRFYILLPFVASFLSDGTAYFVGRAIGKRKLAPSLSPKKTVEGAVGGFVGAILGMVVYGFVWQSIIGPDQSVSIPALALYGALGSVVSQIGDLSFSCIKREYGIKDFGNLFPGHGGVLDRFDSIILCAPLMELLLYFLPPYL